MDSYSFPPPVAGQPVPPPAPVNPPAEPPRVVKVPESELPPGVETRHRVRVGNIGEVEVDLLDKLFVFKQGSTSVLQGVGDILEKRKDIFSPELQRDIRHSPEVVVVCTSDVVTPKTLKREEERAGERTRNVARIVTETKGKEKGGTVHTLNPGRWVGSDDVPLDDQRRVVLLKVIRKDDVMDFKASLLKALESLQEEQTIYKDILHSYSMSRNPDLR